MGAVADVTDIVLPKIEKGIEKVAKAMFIEGDPISKITKVTGLSETEISKLKSEIERD